MVKKSVIRITRTAAMIALLIVVQSLTRSFSQYVTGSLVNLILAVSTLALGLTEGLIIACVSPFLAFLFGIGPAFIQLVPFVALGNAALVAVLYFIVGKNNKFDKIGYIRGYAGCIGASVVKLGVLWLGVTQIGLSLIPDIKPAQIEKMTAMFTWPQLVTALIGTIIAMSIVPVIKKAIKKN